MKGEFTMRRDEKVNYSLLKGQLGNEVSPFQMSLTHVSDFIRCVSSLTQKASELHRGSFMPTCVGYSAKNT